MHESPVHPHRRRAAPFGLGRIEAAVLWSLWVLLATALVAGTAASAPRLLHNQPSPLETLVPGLNEGPAEARFDFAVLVLDALIVEHQRELERARVERPRGPASQQKVQRWRAATSAFLHDLQMAQAALYSAREVEVHRDPHVPLRLRIDGAPIWLAWPRVETQWSLEQNLVEAFCRHHACAGSGGTAPESVAVRAGRADGGSWTLVQGRLPAWESADGVRCEFGDLSDRLTKAGLCQRLTMELRSLVPLFQEAALAARDIQWKQLAIGPEPGGPQHRLKVNDRGDYLRAALPTLARESVDWIAIGQWLNARMQGRPARVTVLRVL